MKLASVMGPSMIVAIQVVFGSLYAASSLPFTLKDFQTSAVFELVVNDSKPLPSGTSKIATVVPGTTVARTVAWKSEELQKYFSDYAFDGKWLILKSRGSYAESEKGRETLRLSWDVDLNLPVVREVKR
jgi:hypothetical protein